MIYPAYPRRSSGSAVVIAAIAALEAVGVVVFRNERFIIIGSGYILLHHCSAWEFILSNLLTASVAVGISVDPNQNVLVATECYYSSSSFIFTMSSTNGLFVIIPVIVLNTIPLCTDFWRQRFL